MQGVVIVVLVAGGIAMPVTFAGFIYTLFYGRRWQSWVMAAIGWVAMFLIVGASVYGWLWNSDVEILGGQDRLNELIAEGQAVLEATAAAVPELVATEVIVGTGHCYTQAGYEAWLRIEGQDGSAAYLDNVQDAWQEMFGITPEHQHMNPRLTVTVGSATYWVSTDPSGKSLSVSTNTPGCVSLAGQGFWIVWPIMLWATILTGWVAMLRVWPPKEGPRWRNRPEEQED